MSILILDETLSYLRFNCIWPRKGQELSPNKCYYIKFVLMIITTSVLLIGSGLHLIVSLQTNTHNISEDLIIVISEIGVYYFISIFVSYQRKIAQIYVDLSDFRKFGKPATFERDNKKLLLFSRIYKVYIDLAVINFCLWPLVSKQYCQRQNHRNGFEDVCGLLATTWMPFDFDKFPVKEILYFWQCFGLLFTMKGAALISFAICESMEHLILRIRHLKFLLHDAIDADDTTEFAKCVRYHIEIFDIGKRIDKCYTGCLFLHIILTGALFGCIGYRFTETFSLNALSLLLGWLLSLFIVCVSGQRLMDECVSVADTAYHSQWYKRDVSFQKSIAFVILRSRKPIIVHAGPFSYVSHVVILTILKTAYSYLTLLQAAST